MLYDDLVQPGEYICHHGVKGQKWGVRHDREKIGNWFTRRKKKREEQLNRNKELAKQLENKKPITIELSGLPWSLDKYGNFITSATPVEISIHKSQINDPSTRQTLDALLKNMDKSINACNKAHSEYISNLPDGVDFGEGGSTVDGFRVAGPSVISSHYHDYGVVSVEMNPRNQQIYYVSYDD